MADGKTLRGAKALGESTVRVATPRHTDVLGRLSLGAVVCIGYLVLHYIVPAVLIWISGFESLIYRQPALGPQQVLYGLLLFVLALVASVGRAPVDRRRVRLRQPPFLPSLAVLGVMLYIAALGFGQGLARWRYASEGLSQGLDPVTVFYVLAPQLFEFLIFLQIFFFRPESAAESVQQRIITLLLVAGLGLTASGIGPMLTVLAVAMYLLFPAQFKLIVFREQGAEPNRRIAATLGLVPMAAIGLVLLIAAVVIGEQIKTGAERTAVTDRYALLSVSEFATYLLERFSTAVISLQVALSNHTTIGWSEVSQNIWAPIGNLLFRVDLVLGSPFGFDRPYAGSLARLNYEAINYYPLNLREGTTPGLLASFLMSFPIPFSILTAVIYISLIRRLLTVLSRGMAGSPTLWGALLVLYFTTGLFASPMDFFLVLDPGFLMLLCYVGAAMVIQRKLMVGYRK